MTSLKALLLVVFLLSFTADRSYALDTETTRLKLSIQCNFRYWQNPNCDQYARDFFDRYQSHFVRVDPSDSTAVHLLITNIDLPGGNGQFTFIYSADPNLYEMQSLTLNIEMSQNLDNAGALNQVTEAIFKSAVPFLDLQTTTEDDDIILKLEAPVVDPNEQKKNDSNNTKLYGETNGSLSTNSSAVNSSLNGNLGAYASYTGDRLKIQINGNAGYQRVSVGNINRTEAQNFSHFERFIGSYSIDSKKKWSIALIALHQQNPGANIDNNTQLGSGVEWNLVPYRTNENQEFMFRVGAARSDLKLNQPNELGFTHDSYPIAFAQFSTYWLLMKNKLNISASAFYAENLKYSGYGAVNLNATTGYQVTNAIRLNWSVGYSYQKRSITFPGNPDFSNPIQSTFLSGAPGKAFSQSIGISINIGNSNTRLRDRRWATF